MLISYVTCLDKALLFILAPFALSILVLTLPVGIPAMLASRCRLPKRIESSYHRKLIKMMNGNDHSPNIFFPKRIITNRMVTFLHLIVSLPSILRKDLGIK